MRRLALLAACLAASCASGTPRVEIPPPPVDHTRPFVRDHALRTGCDACHGVDACARCHLTRPPADHRPGFAGPAHAIGAHADAERCAACHTGGAGGCGRCH